MNYLRNSRLVVTNRDSARFLHESELRSLVFKSFLPTKVSKPKVIIELFVKLTVRFLGYLMEFKSSLFRLVLRTTLVSLTFILGSLGFILF